jgi:hypothetical protein
MEPNRKLPHGRKEAALTEKNDKPNIYPPTIFDPLKPPGKRPSSPDPEGVARDAYLGQLAADVAAQEADSPEPEDSPGVETTAPPEGKPQGGGS